MTAMITAEINITTPDTIKVIRTIDGNEESSLYRQYFELGLLSGLETDGFSKPGSRTEQQACFILFVLIIRV